MIGEATKFLVLLVIGAVAALLLLAGCLLRLLTGAAAIATGSGVCGDGCGFCEPVANLVRMLCGG